jgi:hypothetical protein
MSDLTTAKGAQTLLYLCQNHAIGDLQSISDLARTVIALHAQLADAQAERDGLLRAAHDNHEADKRAEAAEAERDRLAAANAVLESKVAGLVEAARTFRRMPNSNDAGIALDAALATREAGNG